MLKPLLHPWESPRVLPASQWWWASTVGHANTCPCATWWGANHTVILASCNILKDPRLQLLLGEIKLIASFEVDFFHFQPPALSFCQTPEVCYNGRLAFDSCEQVQDPQCETLFTGHLRLALFLLQWAASHWSTLSLSYPHVQRERCLWTSGPSLLGLTSPSCI